MITLQFEVYKQFINRIDVEYPVANSKYYLSAHFTFKSEEWQGQVVTATFTKNDKSYDVLLDANGDCMIPWEVVSAGDFFVSVFTGDVITTNRSRVNVAPSGYTEGGENTNEPTPNIYNQLATQFGELRNEVHYRLDNIDGGLFTDWLEEG